eukprot:705581-Prymnesium_polylepis.1
MGLEAEDTSVIWITGELRTGKQTDKESWHVGDCDVGTALTIRSRSTYTPGGGRPGHIQTALFHTFRYA